ncbi:helix-turn-helix domain-containing protein [Pontibacter sp. JH31]|uniref:Helix-turn-helix domain-containing protein n=1 Tax=Pontibacter aquaedesilientis TaxID=2766980 RepID=A0ABR7XHP4_9BACT|nr:helix-turn-helix transcriptional regulator [Pontibacter aquaedesilientis]MBD1397776.1 helix-turn-helix domain-containing protein [Pontibacter aquaedesilientis]
MRLQEDVIRLILGLKIKQLRTDKNISLTDLANKTGISVSYLNEIEKGKKHPKPSKIAVIADVLGVNYDYLVSLQLSKRLQPVGELLRSNILSELPLEHFGLDISRLLDLFATAPAKLSAFVNTLLEISRAFDLRVEQFYFSALRSYQELHDNYFEELELEVERFLEHYQLSPDQTPSYEQLAGILSTVFNINIETETWSQYPELTPLRSVFIPGVQPRLLLNPNLTEQQRSFAVAREIGFQALQLQPRPYTSTWVRVGSFEEVLNNLKASYFAGALLLNRDRLVQDLEAFFEQPTWQPKLLLQIMENYQTSPETFLHRLTSLLPRFFNIKQLFFLRFHHDAGSDNYSLTKELHLAGLHNPHASFLNEHYCRRWVSLTLFQELEQQKLSGNLRQPLVGIQRSSYINSTNEYLVLALAQPTESMNGTISIGLLINENLRRKVRFLNDPAILQRLVNETCERCPALDCLERASPPLILEKQQWQEKVVQTLEVLKD